MLSTILEFLRGLPNWAIWAVVIVGLSLELYFGFFRKKKKEDPPHDYRA